MAAGNVYISDPGNSRILKETLSGSSYTQSTVVSGLGAIGVAVDGGAVVDFVVETVDLRHLNRLVDKLRRVPGVHDVQRVQKI